VLLSTYCRVMKSGKVKWVGHESEMHTKMLSLQRRREESSVNTRIILKWVWVCGLDSSGEGWGPVAGSCELGS
jgi:hypothetical protein